jgi:2-dehydro-3-deoxyphosphooctonate aldolase (KDO 8-P synthase)
MSDKNTTAPVSVGSVEIGPGCGLALIAGPCVIESREHTLRMAEAIKKVADKLNVPLIFKASFDKANRSSISSYRGPGLVDGLKILDETCSKFEVPVTSDIHEPSQAAVAAEVLELLQVPAFLARQTDLVVACAETGKTINVKKGQFMSPHEMYLVAEKARSAGQGGVLLTERGTTFGYGRLMNDMTGISIMARIAPVVIDATHSCQMPGQGGQQTAGQREMVPTVARAAIAAGAHALFLEVHDKPEKAKSDPTTVWPLDQLEALLSQCVRIHEVVQAR